MEFDIVTPDDDTHVNSFTPTHDSMAYKYDKGNYNSANPKHGGKKIKSIFDSDTPKF